MLYPKFDVLVPKPNLIKDNFAYVIAQNDLAFSKFINEWLAIHSNNNSITKLYDYWILGKNLNYKKPRWSIWNNVLGMKNDILPPLPVPKQIIAEPQKISSITPTSDNTPTALNTKKTPNKQVNKKKE